MFERGQKVRITTTGREGEILLHHGGGWYSVKVSGRFELDVQEKNLEAMDTVLRRQTESDDAQARRIAMESRRAAIAAKILDEMAGPGEAELATGRDAELAAFALRLKKSHTDKDDLTARQEREQIQGRYDDGVRASRERMLASEEYRAAVAAAVQIDEEDEDDGA